MTREGHYWALDAGLAVSMGGFRAAMAEAWGESYTAHLQVAGDLYAYDALRGTDEAMMALYLLAHRRTRAEETRAGVTRVCVERVALFSHPRWARGTEPRPRAWPQMVPPRYDPQAATTHTIVYDGEVAVRTTLRRLQWESAPQEGARASAGAGAGGTTVGGGATRGPAATGSTPAGGDARDSLGSRGKRVSTAIALRYLNLIEGLRVRRVATIMCVTRGYFMLWPIHPSL